MVAVLFCGTVLVVGCLAYFYHLQDVPNQPAIPVPCGDFEVGPVSEEVLTIVADQNVTLWVDSNGTLDIEWTGSSNDSNAINWEGSTNDSLAFDYDPNIELNLNWFPEPQDLSFIYTDANGFHEQWSNIHFEIADKTYSFTPEEFLTKLGIIEGSNDLADSNGTVFYGDPSKEIDVTSPWIIGAAGGSDVQTLDSCDTRPSIHKDPNGHWICSKHGDLEPNKDMACVSFPDTFGIFGTTYCYDCLDETMNLILSQYIRGVE